MGAERLAEYSSGERGRACARAETWVAEHDGRVAGFVAVGPARDPDADAATGELYAIYVDPPAQGAGLGGRLHDRALECLAALGFTSATLWVFEQNGLARSFYGSRGWTAEPSGVGNDECDRWAPSLRYRIAVDADRR